MTRTAFQHIKVCELLPFMLLKINENVYFNSSFNSQFEIFLATDCRVVPLYLTYSYKSLPMIDNLLEGCWVFFIIDIVIV